MVSLEEVYDRSQAALEAIATGDRFAVRRAIEALEVSRDYAAEVLGRGTRADGEGAA